MDPDKHKNSDALVFFQDMKQKQRKESVSARELKKLCITKYVWIILVYLSSIDLFGWN